MRSSQLQSIAIRLKYLQKPADFFLPIACVVAVLLSLSGCVSNKRYVYLQNKAEEKSAVDSITQNLPEPYIIKPRDILYINIKSIYPEAIEIMSQSILQNSRGGGGNNLNQGGQRGRGGGGAFFYLQGYSVSDTGYIEMPLIENIKAAGISTEELEKRIQSELKKHFKDIVVEVKLPGIRINVMGEVANPGPVTFFHNLVDIYEVLNRAGDCNEIADRRNVLVIRRDGENNLQQYTLDLTDAKTLDRDLFYLQHNDFVYVRPLKLRQYGLRSSGLQNLNTVLSSITGIVSFITLILLFDDRLNN
jgi:polysaccharide export outer membrane protein